jgi:serine/tyrosine/threonine adenylyltransferase
MSDCGLDGLIFSNRFTHSLPGDPIPENYSRQVLGALYSRVRPTPVSNPQLLGWADDVGQMLGIDIRHCDREHVAQVFAGNVQLPGMEPYASCYGGHQFGHWAGQLGDGRAINLGEVTGLAVGNLILQLKGAGPTPYSRHADGRAVLRSSVREFLCSEAMHHLGVPTTRALSLVRTGETVIRDMFYDGNPQAEQGAIVCRVAASFTRFGHFDLPAARNDTGLLKQLLDFSLSTDWPDLHEKRLSACSEAQLTQVYLEWFRRVCDLTQQMIVHWMRVGFVHGVMNTDNMSVLGLTIDYGPYGWIDDYDPHWTPNTTDFQNGRYRFGQQAAIARWNLYQLANAIYPLTGEPEALQQILDELPHKYKKDHEQMMAAKLGLPHVQNSELLTALETLLTQTPTDMTLFYRQLADFDSDSPQGTLIDVVAPAFYVDSARSDTGQNTSSYTGTQSSAQRDVCLVESYQHWEKLYRQAIVNSHWSASQRREIMNTNNPRYVLRNYLAQEVIEDLQRGDENSFHTLMSILRTPYETQPEHISRFGQKRPEWARFKAGCSTLSCSS